MGEVISNEQNINHITCSKPTEKQMMHFVHNNFSI